MSSTIPSTACVPFPLLIDFQKLHNGDQTYSVLVPNSPDGHISLLTYRDLYNGVVRAAHLVNPITPHCNPQLPSRVVAIMAVTDNIIHQTLVMGIIRSGCIALPISNRNSAAAVVNLLRKTNCHDIIVGGSSIASLLDETQSELGVDHHLRAIEIPALAYLFPRLGVAGATVTVGDVPPYPAPSDVDSLDAVRMYIHSSGTTSLPKPIPLTERYIRALGSSAFVKASGNIKLMGAMASPPFHLMGSIAQVISPLYNGSAIALWSSSDEGIVPPVPTPSNVLDALTLGGCTATMVTPSFLVDWAHNEKAVEFLRGMQYLMSGGGPLPDEIGDYMVKRGVHVVSMYGGTEFSVPIVVDRVIGTQEEWAWLEFSSQSRLNWLEHDVGGETLFELQVLSNETFMPAAINNETSEGPAYNTNDLFVRHPTKKDLYKIAGRLDDQVTLATGEKVNPGPIETSLAESPLVHGAVVVGRARNQVGVIVEPTAGFEVIPDDDESLANFRRLLWPTVEAANRQSAGFARIFKEAIIPTVPGKVLPRTPKGSVQRKRAIELYDEEIEKMYSAIEKAKGSDDIVPPESWSAEDLEPWLKASIEELLVHPVERDCDIFNHGADSLTAAFLRNRIIGVLRKSDDATLSSKAKDLDADIVFSHPTVLSLARHVSAIVGESPSDVLDPVERQLRNMDALIAKYTSNIAAAPLSQVPPPLLETVLITGTTGALGSLMLAQLLADERIERVWAVNRPGRGRSLLERQREAFVEKAIDISLVTHEKLRLVEADLSENNLGLSESLYDEIRSTTTLVVHNAWRLDFNLSVMSFESNIKGTRHLADLALASPHASAVRFIFISSVGTLLGWKDASAVVPEEPINDPRIAVGNGYGESKYVTEKILETISERTGLATTSIRVGQMSGSDNGFWSTTDWVPIILASSIHLGYLPDARGVVSWIPLDGAASSVLEVGLARHAAPQGIAHLYHPRPVAWSSIVQVAADALMPLTSNSRLPLVPWSEWFAKLEICGQEDTQRIPGLKLLPFYRALAAGDVQLRSLIDGSISEELEAQREALGFVMLATEKMRALSPTLRNMATIDQDHPRRWIEYWRSKGLFTPSY